MTTQRLIDFGFFSLLLLALITAGCAAEGEDESAAAGNGTEAARRSVRVETLVLEPTSFEDVIQITGAVASPNDATLSAQSAGTLEYRAPLGQRVARSAVIARLDQGIVNAALQQAEAQVENAQAQLEWDEYNYMRQERLHQDSIISALEFQTAQTQRNRARAALRQAHALQAQAQEQLENTILRAPFNGTVEAHFAEEGEQLSPGTPVIRLVDTRQMKVTVGVPERYAGDIEVGTPVRLGFQAYRGSPQEGRVRFAGSAIDPEHRTFPIEIQIDNPDGLLKPEMIAQVYVTRQMEEGVIVVPQSAVLRDENGIGVYVVTREGDTATAHRRAVTLGSSYAGRALVEEGLQANDEIIVLGQSGVVEGDNLNIIEQYTRLDDQGVPVKGNPVTAMTTSAN